MLEYKIQLKRTGSITKFVESMNSVPGEAMLIGKNRRVNAKSLLGVMNTDKDEVLTLTFTCEETDIAGIKPYLEQCCAE